jgi:hypothetical protein
VGTKPVKEKSALDLSLLPPSAQSEYDALPDHQKAAYVGIGNKKRKNWDIPKYNAAEGEQVTKNGNAFIVLGRDRRTDILSGFGGRGSYHCAAIDIVVGRSGYQARSIDDEGAPFIADGPDFKLDAARIYMSQKTDVDTYFAIGADYEAGSKTGAGALAELEGFVPPSQTRSGLGFTTEDNPRSAIALKADTIRILSRENIKIVTRTDRRNAQGGLTNNVSTGRYGIDLVAMNKFDEIQPMVRGDNMKMCLMAIVDSIASLRNQLENYMSYNNDFQKRVMSHTHISPFFGITVPPSVQDLIPAGAEFFTKSALNAEVPCMLQHSQETNTIKSDFLGNEGGSRGEKYILSNYNRNN